VSGDGRLRFGLIGFGVGKLYAACLRALHDTYPDLPSNELVAIATASTESGQAAVAHFGFARATTDYRQLIGADDIDALVIASPPRWHLPMLVEALASAKALYVDKPLARSLAEAQQILAIARELGRDGQMIFEFRFWPAVQLAKRLLDEGRLGQIYAFRGKYFRSSYADPDVPLRWKGQLAESGGGVLNDTAPHILDLLTWLLETPDQVMAATRTFVSERPRSKSDRTRVAIDTDDHALLTLTLPGGAVGTVEAGRMVTGSIHDVEFEIYGSRASLRWSLMDTNHLYYAENAHQASQGGWRQIPTVQHYPQAAIPGWDVPVGMMRFHLASLAAFVRATIGQQPYNPGLEQGARVQAIVEAARQSATQHRWVDVSSV
jgi:predicted dehydrogenase